MFKVPFFYFNFSEKFKIGFRIYLFQGYFNSNAILPEFNQRFKIFGALHWLNAGVWGNATQIIITFTFTFTMGLLFAYAYAKTFSLLMPFAIHYGWNLTLNFYLP